MLHLQSSQCNTFWSVKVIVLQVHFFKTSTCTFTSTLSSFFLSLYFSQVHQLCTFTCLVYISFDGTERDGRCCGLGRPFCSEFSAVGDVLHFHFAQGYRLDVMYFVSTSESDTLILDMNHDGD